MNKKEITRRAIYIVILLLGLAYLKYFHTTSQPNDINNIDFRDLPLKYTDHAKCRMDCRFIDQNEILDILKNGTINYKKSDLDDLPCPSYALEGITKDNQEVRIIFADCEDEVRVITAIDLAKDHDCYCK